MHSLRTVRPRRRLAVAASACALLLFPASLRAQRPAPRLVLLLVVDQMRPDYFTRYGALPGGLGRLYRTGAVYPDAQQDHAVLHTAPGHATLLSGRTPASTGIISNDRGVGDPGSPLLGERGDGASPHRFRGTALYDWMRAADPDARVLAVSRKDRGAILPVGRARGNVYWSYGGRFTTSGWYADSLPDWVRAWNRRGGARALAGREWGLLLPDSAYAEPDSMPFENAGGRATFPHRIPADSAELAGRINYLPWMDSLTLDFALEGVRRLQIGSRVGPDLLVVSLSTTDAIGHRFGPDSREQHDQIRRLDRWLGWFLDSLAASAPVERTLIALSADHGISSMPEHRGAVRGAAGGRLSLSALVRAIRRSIDSIPGPPVRLTFESGLLSADTAALRARGVDPDSLAFALADTIGRRPEIVAVYPPRTLARARAGDPHARRWRRHLPPDHPWLVAAVLRDNWMWGGPGEAHHGSSQPDDRRVPIIVAGSGVRPGVYRRAARTTDIGPTLAALLGLRPAEPTDGRPLPEVVGRGAR